MVTVKDTKRGRFYSLDGGTYVSVTTVIGEGLPKPALNRWFVKSMAEKAIRERHITIDMAVDDAIEHLLTPDPTGLDAAKLGSSIHSLVERISKGIEIPEPTDEQRPFLDGFAEFREKYQPIFIETESTVFSKEHGYAGTMDAVVEIEGKRYVVDYKTGRAIWPEAALQISAYRYSEFISRVGGEELPMLPCDGGLVVHLRPKGYEVIPVDCGPQTYDTFLSALDLYRWLNIDSVNALGAKWE